MRLHPFGLFFISVRLSLYNPAEASNNQKPNISNKSPVSSSSLLFVLLLNCLITNSLDRYFLLFGAGGAAQQPHTGRVITGSFVLAVAHQM
jgi:hypothetical protein